MKKFLKIAGGIFLLLLIILLATPFLFKDRIVKTIKDNVNASLEAQVDFGNFDLSLIRDFPDFTFMVKDITVDGIGTFDSLRLASIGEASFSLDLMSVIKGEKMMIHGVAIDDLYMNAVVLEDGTANYDIIKETETTEGESTDVRDEYVILLERYELNNAHIIYENRSMQMFMEIQGLDHSGEGKLSDKIYDLLTTTSASDVDVVYEGVQYLKDAETEIEANFDIQDDFRTYNLKENEIRLNQLFLTAEGVVLMPEDGVDMDIKYRSTQTDLKNLLSLVPADYMPNLEGLDTQGTISLSGGVKGHYDDNNLPAFNIVGDIKNGRIQYPDLPESIDEINTDVDVVFPGGSDFDAMTVNVERLHMTIAGSPINASLFTKNMLSDPYIKSDIQSQLNLSKVKEAVDLEGVKDLEGIITADIGIGGRMSSIEQERYEDFKATGQVIMQDFLYRSDSLPDTRIDRATLNFDPRYLEMPDFRMTIGNSDLSAQGRINNYLAYYLKDEVIQGRFNVQSQLFDLNEFMSEGEAEANQTEASGESTPMAVVEVPGNVDFDLNTDIKKLRYGDMEMMNVKGQVKIKDYVAAMNNVKMDMLGGGLSMNGAYSTLPDQAPKVDFGLNINSFDIPSTATTFNTVQTLAPLASQTKGDFSSGMTFTTALDQGMNPIYSSLTGGGNLTTSEVILENFPALAKIATALKQDKWTSQRVKNVKLAFKFIEGKVAVEPFDIKLDGMETTVGGTMSFEQDLDYNVKIKVPVAKLGGQANQLMEGLLGKANSLGLNLSMGEFVNMNFNVTGKFDNPQVKPSLLGQDGAETNVKDVVKETIMQEIDDKKEELIDDGKEKAREEADKILAQAQEKADLVKKEARNLADETRKQGEAAAKKLEDEAKNPFAKAAAKIAADKLRQEADKKADSIVEEADKQAANIMTTAQSKADQLLQ